jgi:nucleolysin TIA-1/TIAR
MNGEWLGSRAIRVNWANQKTQTGGTRVGGFGGTAPAPSNFSGGSLDYDTVATQTPGFNSTVYVGNLIPYSTQADLIPLFQGYGYIVEIRMQADRGFAFVKLDTHEHAAQAIVNLQNYPVHGRPIKCSWGKDREGGGPVGAPGAVPAVPGVVQQPGMGMMGGYPTMVSAHDPVVQVAYADSSRLASITQMYGMQPNAYAQYAGYPGYQAYGQPAVAGAAAAASPQQVSTPAIIPVFLLLTGLRFAGCVLANSTRSWTMGRLLRWSAW